MNQTLSHFSLKFIVMTTLTCKPNYYHIFMSTNFQHMYLDKCLFRYTLSLKADVRHRATNKKRYVTVRISFISFFVQHI